ncbi:hypothetical protein BDY17DRAFT_325463 [Neohortaea acidophila]|uniref:Protein SQS1 n=1 Tax=Neohortaea acidophila TaxID=245834 RepID=A0A6A6PPC9_9PEZI|nr:uncharacterized protein BDY17DRAFT_325463 [Neohortaea acidophila]KAF2481960.1 hypothetical protein BDY17DRAFT_325463 [Neohortaea acidophila]
MPKKKANGKSPRGRAGAKQKAQRGASGGGWMQSLAHMSKSMADDDYDDDTHKNFRGFAQKNAFDSSPRNPSLKLRHQVITFVSAGSNTPVDTDVEAKPELRESDVLLSVARSDEESEDEEDVAEELDDANLQTNIITDTQFQVSRLSIRGDSRGDAHDTSMDVEVMKSGEYVRPSSPPALPFVVDTVGDGNLGRGYERGGQHSAPRAASPAPSNSSEEVVLFHGRNRPNVIDDPVGAPSSGPKATHPVHNSTPAPYSPDIPAFQESTMPMAKGSADPRVQKVEPEVIWAPAPAGAWWRKKDKQRADGNSSHPDVSDDATPNEHNVAYALAQLDGEKVGTSNIGKAELKMIQRLAKITRVQAKDDASPPTKPKKVEKMKTRLQNIALLESQMSKEHVRLARLMGEGEAVRLEKAAGQRMQEKWDGRAGPSAFRSTTESDDAEDVITSLQADWKAFIREKHPTKPNPRRKRGKRKESKSNRDIIDSGEDADDIEESAYDDYMANLAAQLDETDGDGNVAIPAINVMGPSLVVDGKEVADDEILRNGHSSEEPDYILGMIGSDDGSSDTSGPIGQDLSDMSEYDSSELEERLEYTEQEQWEDEEDLRQRRRDRMTDEQLARLFAKQEELGIHGDDIVIENGEYGELSDAMDGVGDITAARAGLAEMAGLGFAGASKSNGSRRRSGRGNDTFPDASALADTVEQYGEHGFDIMDFDRPSLRPTKKGRKGRPPPELEALSDDELRETMMSTWDNDRAKKRLKKAEREDLRMQGLLGSAGKSGKADLSQKYPLGISTRQIHEELRIFLQDDGQTSRALPPMHKTDRKDLHEIAVVLSLKSKSVGSGKNRSPVLYKTSRTPAFDPLAFNRAVRASANGWLDNDRRYGGKGSKKPAKVPKGFGGGGGGGGAAGAASVRTGEVVGAGAAEIGKENFGHRLMEKMGWSKGMALGKEGEGRLMPVEQIMRAGRAGLG